MPALPKAIPTERTSETHAPAVSDLGNDPAFEVEAVLAWHEGDARQAIRTLLDDCRHLKLQLALTEGAMSHGMTRGWLPSYERKADTTAG